MVVDTSALLAIAFREPDAATFAQSIGSATRTDMSAANRFEASLVMMRRVPPDHVGRRLNDLVDLVARLELRIQPVTEQQVRIATDAYRRYGKGFHSAALNFGDCFAYALAIETGAPLLFKGTDFAATDVAVA